MQDCVSVTSDFLSSQYKKSEPCLKNFQKSTFCSTVIARSLFNVKQNSLYCVQRLKSCIYLKVLTAKKLIKKSKNGLLVHAKGSKNCAKFCKWFHRNTPI